MDIGEGDFKTKDYYLSIFLKSKDIKLKEAVRQGNLVIFCFEENGGLRELVNNFYQGSEVVEVSKFISALREIKSLVYNVLK